MTKAAAMEIISLAISILAICIMLAANRKGRIMENQFYKRYINFTGSCPGCKRPINGETIDTSKANELIDYTVNHPVCPCCHREIMFEDMEGE